MLKWCINQSGPAEAKAPVHGEALGDGNPRKLRSTFCIQLHKPETIRKPAKASEKPLVGPNRILTPQFEQLQQQIRPNHVPAFAAQSSS